MSPDHKNFFSNNIRDFQTLFRNFKNGHTKNVQNHFADFQMYYKICKFPKFIYYNVKVWNGG